MRAALVCVTAVCGVVATCALAVTGCGPTPQPKPLSELSAQESRGHTLYQTRCAVCHYDRKLGVLHGPSMSGVFKKAALPSGAAATDERVSATVLHGRNNMPAMGNQIDEQDLGDLLAYLHTL